MSSHRVQPGFGAQLQRHARDEYTLMPPPLHGPMTVMPKGHRYTLPRKMGRVEYAYYHAGHPHFGGHGWWEPGDPWPSVASVGPELVTFHTPVRDAPMGPTCPVCGDMIVGGFVWVEDDGRQVHLGCSQMIATIRRNNAEETQ